jgi:hypothetical protein
LDRAEGEIGIALRIRRRAFNLNLRPVGIELFRDDGGDAGVGTLAHFDVLRDHRHAVVGTDPQEGVGCKSGSGARSGGAGERAARRSAPLESYGECNRAGRAGRLEKIAACPAERFACFGIHG